MGVSGRAVTVVPADTVAAGRGGVDPHPASRAVTQYNATTKEVCRMVGVTPAGTLAFRSGTLTPYI
jgi:hypothetical protein